jgi:hypothetical protein
LCVVVRRHCWCPQEFPSCWSWLCSVSWREIGSMVDLSLLTMSVHASTMNNHLWITRTKRGIPRKKLAALLGHKSTSQLCRWEEGCQLQSLQRPPPQPFPPNAGRFLFKDLWDDPVRRTPASGHLRRYLSTAASAQSHCVATWCSIELSFMYRRESVDSGRPRRHPS